MAKRPDVGMAGSSGYDSEFYTRNFEGNVVPNKRTMRLQGMDPKRQIEDSVKQERRVQGRAAAGLPMTDRDKARMKAVGGDVKSWGRFSPETYDETDFQDSVRQRDEDLRQKTFDRDMATQDKIADQKRKFAAQQQYGDNSFKQAAPLTKAMMAEYKKKNK